MEPELSYSSDNGREYWICRPLICDPGNHGKLAKRVRKEPRGFPDNGGLRAVPRVRTIDEFDGSAKLVALAGPAAAGG